MSAEPDPNGTGFKYWAFLSYSHTDRKWGDWLHKALETYRIPRRLVGTEARDGSIPARLFPIFRDREELPVSSDLGANINEALRESRYLIVVCSPRSARSRWVGEEIKAYKGLGREDRILALIIDGEPNASDGKPGFKPEDECFHEAMRYRSSEDGQLSQIRTEPIAADARADKDGKNNAKLKLLAGLLGVNYDDLKRREQERRIQRLRIVIGFTAALVSVFIALSIYAWRQKQTAEVARSRAQSALDETRKTLSQSYFLEALRSINEDRDCDALAQLARSVSFNQGNQAAACRLFTLLTSRNHMLPLFRLTGCNATALPLQFSPDGKCFVTISGSNTARLRNAQTGEPFGDPMTHNGDISSVQFSPDGKQIVTGSADKTTRVWSATDGKPVGQPIQDEGRVSCAQFSRDGNRVVTVTEIIVPGNPQDFMDRQVEPILVIAMRFRNNRARVWDTHTGKLISEPLKENAYVTSASFSADGKRIVTTASNRIAQVWDAETGAPISAPLKHDSIVSSAEFSPDGKRLVTGSFDQTARVWDVETARLLYPPLTHTGIVDSVHFSPDGRRIVTASRDHTARLWNAENGQPISDPMKHSENVVAAQFSTDGTRIITASDDTTARIWDARTGLPVSEPMKHDQAVRSASLSADGRRVITAASDNTVVVWNSETARHLPLRLVHRKDVVSAEFSPDNKWIVTASEDRTAQVWDAETGKPVGEPLRHLGRVPSAKFSPDGRRIVTASEDAETGFGRVQVWDTQTGRSLSGPMMHESAVWAAQFSPDGKRIVSASSDHTARIWHSENGQPLMAPLKHAAEVWFAQFSPDGHRIVTASADKTARIWDAETGKSLSQPLDHPEGVASAQFSPDGKRIVTTAHDNMARVWDSETGKPLAVINNASALDHARFSFDGKRIVTASQDGARIWDTETGQSLTEAMKQESGVTDAVFSPDGQLIATVSTDHSVRIREAQTGKQVSETMKHDNVAITVAFSSDGRRIVTASYDHSARVWDVKPSGKLAPTWLPRLAEAFAGQRLNDRGFFEPLSQHSCSAIDAVRGELSQTQMDDDWATWGRWLLADRSARSISPFSQTTVAEYLGALIQEHTSASLDEAEMLAAGNPELLQRVSEARRTVQPTTAP